MPGYLFKHNFWMYLGGCFWKRLALGSVDYIEQMPPQEREERKLILLTVVLTEKKG